MKIRENILPVLKPYGGEEEIKLLKEVISSGWWGKGSKVEQLEKKFAELVGTKHALAVTSNSIGQDLILKANNISNCNVISPTVSFMTTGIVPLWNNCKSILCDVDEKTLNLDPADVKDYIDTDTGAIISINYAGIQSNIDELKRHYSGLIIEDCALSCYSPGAGLKGDVSVWSFQAVKTLSCGDGGMITTNDSALYDKLKPMINFGIPSTTYERSTKTSKSKKNKLSPGYVWDYEVNSLGYKAYMNDIQASIALAQLDKLNQFIKRRKMIQKTYNSELKEYIQLPPWSETAQLYPARVEKSHRNSLMNYLASKNIHTTVHFKPLHLHPILKHDRNFPVANKEWKKLISFPCHAGMKDSDIEYVVYWIKRYFKKHNCYKK